MAMKNLMGIVWNPTVFHWSGLDDCISDICLYRKPDLNILDAYRVTIANGPQYARDKDVVLKKTLLLSDDIVSIDAAGAKMFGKKPENIYYIKKGHEQNLGEINLKKKMIKKIVL